MEVARFVGGKGGKRDISNKKMTKKMKVAFECIQCQEDWFKDKSSHKRILYIKEITNSHDPVTFTCPKGHTSTYEITSPQYEILYSIACYAIIDGYYREAIASFNACLEMFYDYSLRVILDYTKIEDSFIKCLFKEIKLSERRFGAFTAAWLLLEGKPYTDKSVSERDAMTKLRNTVVHNGTIPTKKEAIEFGNYVCDIIKPIIKTLVEKYSSSIKNINFPQNPTSVEGHQSIFCPLDIMIRDDKAIEDIFETIKLGYEIHGYKDAQPDTYVTM